MKARCGFVTNSSSSNFIIFGNSKESIIKRVRDGDMFGEINDSILRQLENTSPISGAVLKKLYDDEILWAMTHARNRVLGGLSSSNPYEWMYTTTANFISKESGLISAKYLAENVAFEITLDDTYGAEHFGWMATGFHHEANSKDDMVLVIGINGH